MDLGIFAKTFPRAALEETLDAVATFGFTSVHWNMSCAGLPSMPDSIDPAVLRRIHRAASERGIEIATLSGTFNMIHPEPKVRRRGLDGLKVLAAACEPLGTRIITLCTGTRNEENKWCRHPDNDTDAAWSDLNETMTEALAIASEHNIKLGIEPEPGNVVSTAARARRLLDEIDSPLIGIVLDPANLIEGVSPDLVEDTIDEGFRLLGDRIISAHGKDRAADGSVQPAGKGIVRWARFIDGLHTAGYDGPLIMQGLSEADVPEAVSVIRREAGGS